MRELSVFVDESGDFGEFESHAPYYIISLVLHDQKIDIHESLSILENEMALLNWLKLQHNSYVKRPRPTAG